MAGQLQNLQLITDPVRKQLERDRPTAADYLETGVALREELSPPSVRPGVRAGSHPGLQVPQISASRAVELLRKTLAPGALPPANRVPLAAMVAEASSRTDLVGVLVFDSAPLCAFSRAHRLAELERLTTRGGPRHHAGGPRRDRCGRRSDHPKLDAVLQLPWLRVVSLDSLAELRLFAAYADRLGTGDHDVGEASVLAWPEAHGATAFTDDEAAVQAGRDRMVVVRRTLFLVALGVKAGVLAEEAAVALVDELIAAGARMPLRAGEFGAWARERGLL